MAALKDASHCCEVERKTPRAYCMIAGLSSVFPLTTLSRPRVRLMGAPFVASFMNVPLTAASALR